ncbi:SAF domain-containing protein [Candidatus Poriferisodalis sp.]|uniref:SAF domain-containing protein n=1 Tax=Candidatus Poriferisodalis sp. TaxID=3101277 RepID=UPI003B02E689
MTTDPLLTSDRRGLGPSAAHRRAGRASRSRLVVGGALCGAAALGLWWVLELSATDAAASYVVARTRLAPGQVIDEADVALVAVRLPAEIEATVFSDGDGVVGSVVIDAVHAGELLTRGDVDSRRSASDRRAGYAIAVELERPAALNGLIAAGERVEAVVTDPRVISGGLMDAHDTADGVETVGAVVLDLDDHSRTEPTSGTITVTLQVHDRAAAITLAAAAQARAITLIRPWGTSSPSTT